MQNAFQLVCIRDIDYRRCRDGTIQSHIFKRHVCTAVESCADTCIRTDYGDIVSGVAGCQEYLVEAAAGSKRSKSMADRFESLRSQTSCNTDHICFCDTAVDCSVRMCSAPFCRADTAHKVSIQVNNVRIIFC